MTTIALTPAQLTARLKQDAERYPAVVRLGLKRGAHRGRALLAHESPTDTGQLKNAWKVTENPLPGAGGAPSIRNDAPHAGIIERGARPHPVSREGVEAIKAWVRRVLGAQIKTKMRGGSPRGRVSRDAFEAQVESVTWAIVTKLGKEGQKGKFIVEQNLETLARFAREEVERVLAAHLNRPVSGGGGGAAGGGGSATP
jgi:hypothetical protein